MKKRVIIFEDSKSFREILIDFLLKRNYEVISFSDPCSCPYILKDNCPCPKNSICADYLITDFNMPCMNGLELIQNQFNKGCKIKNIIILTSGITQNYIKKAEKIGVKVLEKEMKLNNLKKWLDECSKKHKLPSKYWDWFELKK